MNPLLRAIIVSTTTFMTGAVSCSGDVAPMHELRSLEQAVLLECDPAGCTGTVGSYDSGVSIDDMRSCTQEERGTAEAAARADMGNSAELEYCDYGIASSGGWFLVYYAFLGVADYADFPTPACDGAVCWDYVGPQPTSSIGSPSDCNSSELVMAANDLLNKGRFADMTWCQAYKQVMGANRIRYWYTLRDTGFPSTDPSNPNTSSCTSSAGYFAGCFKAEDLTACLATCSSKCGFGAMELFTENSWVCGSSSKPNVCTCFSP